MNFNEACLKLDNYLRAKQIFEDICWIKPDYVL